MDLQNTISKDTNNESNDYSDLPVLA